MSEAESSSSCLRGPCGIGLDPGQLMALSDWMGRSAGFQGADSFSVSKDER